VDCSVPSDAARCAASDDRVRNRADLRADVNPTDALSFGVAGQYQVDDYGAAERFGFISPVQRSASWAWRSLCIGRDPKLARSLSR